MYFKNIFRIKYQKLLPWILFAASLAVIFFLSYKLVYLQRNPEEINRIEANKIVKAVGKLIILPADETPTIATVTDKEALKEYPFFNNASVGDRVLIYEKAGKAVLYNPALNKVVEIAPFNLGAGK